MATDSNTELKTTQLKAIAALLSEPDIKTAAKKAGVGERTLHTWLKEDEAFQEALKQAEQEAVSIAVTRLAGSAGKALDVLNSILDDDTVAAGVRTRAALGLLDKLIQLKQFADLEQRLARIEEALLPTKNRNFSNE